MKAFPTVTGAVGMDLRDYFAAKAMQSLMTNIKNVGPLIEFVPQAAYEWADAMMKARENHE